MSIDDMLTMATFQALSEFATACRLGLETVAAEPHSIFAGFPVGTCGSASDLMGRLLAERLGIDGIYVCGVGHPDLDALQSHAWVEAEGFILDITYDQFAGTGIKGWVSMSSGRHLGECHCGRSTRPR